MRDLPKTPCEDGCCDCGDVKRRHCHGLCLIRARSEYVVHPTGKGVKSIGLDPAKGEALLESTIERIQAYQARTGYTPAAIAMEPEDYVHMAWWMREQFMYGLETLLTTVLHVPIYLQQDGLLFEPKDLPMLVFQKREGSRG